MTDRHAGYIITLKEDIREDDAERLISALGLMQGVLTVEPVVSDSRLHIAEMRARHELGSKVIDLIFDRKDTR